MTDQNIPPVPPSEPTPTDAADALAAEVPTAADVDAAVNEAVADAAAPAAAAAPEFVAPEVPAAPAYEAPAAPEAPAYAPPAAPAAPAYGAPAAPAYTAPAAPGYGTPAYNPAPFAAPKTNTFAIVSLVASIAGVITGITFLVGIIFGHLSLSQIKKTGEQGRGMAIAGLIIGYVGIALTVIAVIFFIIAFALVASNPSYNY